MTLLCANMYRTWRSPLLKIWKCPKSSIARRGFQNTNGIHIMNKWYSLSSNIPSISYVYCLWKLQALRIALKRATSLTKSLASIIFIFYINLLFSVKFIFGINLFLLLLFFLSCLHFYVVFFGVFFSKVIFCLGLSSFFMCFSYFVSFFKNCQMISGLPYIDNTSFYCWVKQEIVAQKMLCCGYKRLYIMKLLMSIFNFVVCVFQEYQKIWWLCHS